ncbi:3-oxoacyl-ACP reductase FabG [Rhodoferax ferrireducens]|uniref:3-oxoacyl-ACP reductase FabG n=1 Tax=Rhodoferax ferrireducens TaxID=192843 RepID=UPI000E0D46DB|nr:3-oxoacyl-ACP reductase FabG [Rhodoferax ferrireducens]
MKTALVTGGSGGIGAAICRRLAADGCHVYVHAHHGVATAQALVDSIMADGGSAETLMFDVTDSVAVTQALNPIIEHKPIQILVNNAGIHDDAIFPGMRAEQWHRVIDVSVNGFFNVTHTLMMPMIRSRWGRIVNVSSIAALTGNRGQVNYSAAKGAINSATKSLAQEVASRGITVNAVAPGIIDTAMIASAFKPDDIARLVPMKRVGQPSEVADLIGFLASEQAAYITGQIISINGGMI